MQEKCVICDVRLIYKDVFICESHAKELYKKLKKGENIIKLPSFKEHCMICGEWKNRIIINYPSWNYVCNICLKNALNKYKNGND